MFFLLRHLAYEPLHVLPDLLYSLHHKHCNTPTAHTPLRLLYMYSRALVPDDIPSCVHVPAVSALAVMVVAAVVEVLAVMVSVLVAMAVVLAVMAFVLAAMVVVGQVLGFAVVSAPALTAAK